MKLATGLRHVETEQDLKELLKAEENVMVCCGRMGPMCVPVYGVMEDLQDSGEYDHVTFRDMSFDSPESDYIRRLPECSTFRGLPFTVYFRNGKVVAATSSIQNKKQVTAILNENFS